MHKLSFFPLGNADCIRVDLENGRRILLDYAAMRDPEDEADLRIDLDRELREDLTRAERDYLDVVAFTHLDTDHVKGSTEFFWLEHAEKYQSASRIKIRELWVPAAAIVEAGAKDEARLIRAEAQYRFRKGSGIRVFSRPARLREWLESQGLSLESRKHLITDAGQVVPGFSLASDGVEFFVHSPLAVRQDECTVVDRNADGLVLHATFSISDRVTKALLTADINYDVIADIVRVSRKKGNEDRLEWDIIDVPHHCSYLALGPEKGKESTEPVEEVRALYEEYSSKRGLLISPSWPIPGSDSDLPPHRQAANYYRSRAQDLSGEFEVTMEHPRPSRPETLVVQIDGSGGSIRRFVSGGVSGVVNRAAPRAGR